MATNKTIVCMFYRCVFCLHSWQMQLIN